MSETPRERFLRNHQENIRTMRACLIRAEREGDEQYTETCRRIIAAWERIAAESEVWRRRMNLTEAIEATRRFVQVQEKATPGPWEAGGCLHGNTHRWFPFDEGHELFPPLVDCGPQPGGPVAMVSDGEYENTPLIADARNYPAPEVLKLLERLEWSVSYGEIEAACGGELAQQVWQAVLSRREKIHEELEERQ